jgi:hypothetical protein
MTVFNFGRRMTKTEEKVTKRIFWITFAVSATIFYGLSIFYFGFGHIPLWFSYFYDGILIANITYFSLRTFPHIRALNKEIKALRNKIEEDERRRAFRAFRARENEIEN